MATQPHLKKVKEFIAPGLEEGIIIDTRKEDFALVKGTLNYYMLFTQIDTIVNKINSMPVLKLIHWIGNALMPERNTVNINLTVKQEIAKMMNLSIPGIERAITLMKKDNILMSYGTSRSAMYRINPTYIWKGSTKVREKAMKEYLEAIRISNLPDRERKEVEARTRFEKAMAIEEALYKFDFTKVDVPKKVA